MSEPRAREDRKAPNAGPWRQEILAAPHSAHDSTAQTVQAPRRGGRRRGARGARRSEEGGVIDRRAPNPRGVLAQQVTRRERVKPQCSRAETDRTPR
jgi:hypothetical protein